MNLHIFVHLTKILSNGLNLKGLFVLLSCWSFSKHLVGQYFVWLLLKMTQLSNHLVPLVALTNIAFVFPSLATGGFQYYVGVLQGYFSFCI